MTCWYLLINTIIQDCSIVRNISGKNLVDFFGAYIMLAVSLGPSLFAQLSFFPIWYRSVISTRWIHFPCFTKHTFLLHLVINTKSEVCDLIHYFKRGDETKLGLVKFYLTHYRVSWGTCHIVDWIRSCPREMDWAQSSFKFNTGCNNSSFRQGCFVFNTKTQLSRETQYRSIGHLKPLTTHVVVRKWHYGWRYI